MSEEKMTGWKNSPLRPVVVGFLLLVLFFLGWRTVSVYPCYEKCVHAAKQDCLRRCGFWF